MAAKTTVAASDDEARRNELIEFIDVLLAGHRARTFIEAHSWNVATVLDSREGDCAECGQALARSIIRGRFAVDRATFVQFACEEMRQAHAQLDAAREIASKWDEGEL